MTAIDLKSSHGLIGLLHAFFPPQAICLAMVEDEDRTMRACRWVGPVRTDDPEGYALALDDAIQHIHEVEGWCRYCEKCKGWPA